MWLLYLQISLAAGLFGAGLDVKTQESLLLKSLGLSAKPSPKSPGPVPLLLWKMFQKRAGSLPARKEPRSPGCWVEEFDVPGNIIRVFPDQGRFIHAAAEPRSGLCLQKRLYFNVSALGQDELLTAAQLEIRFARSSYHPYELSLYRASRLALKGMASHTYSRELLVAQSFLPLHTSFTFNLTAAAQDWRSPAKNFGLILEMGAPTLPDGGSLCFGLDSFLDASLLVVSLVPKQCKASRAKRGSYYAPLSASNLCKPRRLYIGFGDVGWQNWIIAPQGYLANYCLGECPFPLTEELNSTNHAILQTMVHSLDPHGTPQPCCVPVHLSPISILYYDNDDNVILRHYEDMVVDECGCR